MIKILIVDDERSIRSGIKKAIDWEKYGIHVCGTAGNAAEALNLIEQHMPAIVITDIRMPDMDGLELLDIINEKYSNIKVILISGYKDFNYAQTAIALNAFCYILKPIDSDELLNKVLEAKMEIEENLRRVKKDEDIRRRLQENITIIRENFLLKLVKGGMCNIQDICKTAESLGLKLNGSYYCIALVQIDMPQKFAENNWYDEGWYKAAVMNKAENILGELFNCYSFNLNGDFGFIISGSNIENAFLREHFELIKDWVNAELGLYLTVGIGNIYSNLIYIPRSYREALDALEYKVVAGKNVVIHIESVYNDKRDKTDVENFNNILRNCEDDIYYALKVEDRNAIYQIVDEIMSGFKHVIKVNIREKDHLMFLLTFFLSKILFSMEINQNKYSNRENDLYKALCSCPTVDDIRSFLTNCFEEAIQEIHNKVKSRNGFLVKQAVEYINVNIYNDISLVKVADHISIHPNYLSKIFKQEKGESFVEYVTKLKMNEAKLLLRNSNSKVYEIANKLRYKDVGHFTRIFKRTYGVSPTEYRQLLS